MKASVTLGFDSKELQTRDKKVCDIKYFDINISKPCVNLPDF